jgi:SAM-dependent methyltransferase
MSRCPVCDASSAVLTVTRDRLPSMQNVVYRTRAEALSARDGAFQLAACPSCGFAWNSAFDPARLAYDDSYDNAVPSLVMARYYDEIADYLGQKYGLARDGYVVDVGCGDGRFLKAIARLWPGCRGLGVDPALRQDEVHADGRVRLVKGVFEPSQLEAAPSLVVCRHVLEHMPDPVGFLRRLRRAIDARPGVPFFAEVPDLGWILEHRAFWDFCYEHCNYFSETSLREAFARAGFQPTGSRVGFGSQYRWIEVVPGSAPALSATPGWQWPGRTMIESLVAYAAEERDQIDAARAQLAACRAEGASIVVWGMATKGVVYCMLVDPDATLIDLAVDINQGKQGRFVPLTGRAIDAPAVLPHLSGRPVYVVVMNPNYLHEIRSLCDELGVSARFLDARGQGVAVA